MKTGTIRYGFSLFILSVALLTGCGGQEQPAGGAGGERPDGKALTVKGSDTMVIMSQRLAEEYMKAHPEAVVQVNGGGSGTGIAALINGTTDLAMASRPMKETEKTNAQSNRGSAVVETPVALDSLAVFVNEANPVGQLTVEQVGRIYKGEITNWKEVGGPDSRIVLYGRESSSGTYDYFREHVLDKADFAPAVQTLQGTAAIINSVAKDPNGIGYGGIAYATGARPLAIQHGEGPAVAPSEESVANRTYPLARELYFYYLANAPERVTEFVNWTLTPEAQSLISEVGYFPLITTGKEMAPVTETAAPTAAP